MKCVKINNNKLYYSGTTLCRYEGTDETIFIPKKFKKIGQGAFKNCKTIKSVVCLNNIVEIGENAFLNCSNLKYIHLSTSLKLICQCGFANIAKNPYVNYCGTKKDWNCKVLRGEPFVVVHCSDGTWAQTGPLIFHDC